MSKQVSLIDASAKVTSQVLSNPSVDAFYQDLIARHPEIDTIAEECPGS
jgi:hypothetical protein